jgi:hypothetical protein
MVAHRTRLPGEERLREFLRFAVIDILFEYFLQRFYEKRQRA